MEQQAILPNELDIYNNCLDKVENIHLLNNIDILQIIRGYYTYDHKQQTIIDIMNEIITFRKDMNYDKIKTIFNQHNESFYKKWIETIYGIDDKGHFLSVIHLGKSDISSLNDYNDLEVTQIVTQKLFGLSKHLEHISSEQNKQVYKYSLFIDFSNIGFNLLSSSYKDKLKLIFNIGSEYFPESIYHIYIVGAPYIFTILWNIIKYWINPITMKKIKFVKLRHIYDMLVKDGFNKDNIPDFVGGLHTGTNVYELLRELIHE